MSQPTRRLVIVVRADPVICGHAGEARNLAEVALTRGFDDVRLLTWPIPTLQAAGLPSRRWRSPAAGSTNCGSVPYTPDASATGRLGVLSAG